MTILLLSAALGGCQTPDKPLHTVAHVDLPRFMGDWYVIANIPTFIERDAHNAVEVLHEEAKTFAYRSPAERWGKQREVALEDPAALVRAQLPSTKAGNADPLVHR